VFVHKNVSSAPLLPFPKEQARKAQIQFEASHLLNITDQQTAHRYRRLERPPQVLFLYRVTQKQLFYCFQLFYYYQFRIPILSFGKNSDNAPLQLESAKYQFRLLTQKPLPVISYHIKKPSSTWLHLF
jgi:hypothetical protein